MALSSSIANSAPVLPNDVAFWEHYSHYASARYYGGVYPAGGYSLNQNCETEHRSSISSDTKFWIRGNDGAYLANFRELDTGIPDGTNFIVPAVPIGSHTSASCGRWNGNRMGNSSFGNPLSLGQRINLNVTTLEDYDSYTIFNRTTPDNSKFQTDDYGAYTQYSSSYFAYQGGSLTKILYNEDPLSLVKAEVSDSVPNPTFRSHGTYMDSQRICQIVYSEGGVQLGNHNCFTTKSGVDNIDNLPTGTTIGFAVKAAFNHYTDQMQCMFASGFAIQFNMNFDHTGRIDNAHEICIGSRIKTHGGAVSESIIDKLFEVTGSYSTGSVSGHGSQYSYDIMNDYLWNGYAVPFSEPFPTPTTQYNKNGWPHPHIKKLQKTSQQISTGIPADVNACQAFRHTTVTGQNNGVTSGSSAYTQSAGYNGIQELNIPGAATWVNFEHPSELKSKSSYSSEVKKPTCECISLQSWQSRPAHKESYKLTFDDGYSFTAGALLRLFSYDPHYQQSETTWVDKFGEKIPRSSTWARNLKSRTPHEMYRKQHSFHGYDSGTSIQHIADLSAATMNSASTGGSTAYEGVNILSNTSVAFTSMSSERTSLYYLQNASFVTGGEYRLRFTVSNYETGSQASGSSTIGFLSNIGTDPYGNGTNYQFYDTPGPGKVRGNGDYEVIFECANTQVVAFTKNCTGTISNIVVNKTIVEERQAFIKCADTIIGNTQTAGYTFLTDIERIDTNVGHYYPENWYKQDLKAGYSRPHFTINSGSSHGVTSNVGSGHTPTAETYSGPSCSINHSTMPHFTEVVTKTSTSETWDNFLSGWLMLENGLHVGFSECNMLATATIGCGPGGCMDDGYMPSAYANNGGGPGYGGGYAGGGSWTPTTASCNYDATATWDDGSCRYLSGCTDQPGGYLSTFFGTASSAPGPFSDVNGHGRLAIYNCAVSTTIPTTPDPITYTASNETGYYAVNYNPCAQCHTSCCYGAGCTNADSNNYDPLACYDDGSCYKWGCTNPLATNYDPTATDDDGSCYIAGCTDPFALNYDSTATVRCTSCNEGGCCVPTAQGTNQQNLNNYPHGCCCITCRDHDFTFTVDRPQCDGSTSGSVTASIGTTNYGASQVPGQQASVVTYNWYTMAGNLVTQSFDGIMDGVYYNEEFYVTTIDAFGCQGLSTFTMPCLSWRCAPSSYTSDDCDDRMFTGEISDTPEGATAFFSSHSIGRSNNFTYDQVPFSASFSNFKYIDPHCGSGSVTNYYSTLVASNTAMSLSWIWPYTQQVLPGNGTIFTNAEVNGAGFSNYYPHAVDGVNDASSSGYVTPWVSQFDNSFEFKLSSSGFQGNAGVHPPYDLLLTTAHPDGAFMYYDFQQAPQRIWKQRIWGNHFDGMNAVTNVRPNNVTMSAANSHSWGIGGGVVDGNTYYSKSSGYHDWHVLEHQSGPMTALHTNNTNVYYESTYAEPTESFRYWRISGLTSNDTDNFGGSGNLQGKVKLNEWEMFNYTSSAFSASHIEGGTCVGNYGCYSYIDHIRTWLRHSPGQPETFTEYHYDWASFVTRMNTRVHGWTHWDDSYLELSASVYHFDEETGVQGEDQLQWEVVTGSCNCVGTDCGCVQDNAGSLTSCGAGAPCCSGLIGDLKVSCSVTPESCNGVGGIIDCIVTGVGSNMMGTNQATFNMSEQLYGTLTNYAFPSVANTNFWPTTQSSAGNVHTFTGVPAGTGYIAAFQDTTLGDISTWATGIITGFDNPEVVTILRLGRSGSGPWGTTGQPQVGNDGCVLGTAGISASFVDNDSRGLHPPIAWSWEQPSPGTAFTQGTGFTTQALTGLSTPLGSIRAVATDVHGCKAYSEFVDIPCGEFLVGCQDPRALNYSFTANSASCLCEPTTHMAEEYGPYSFSHEVRHRNTSQANSGAIRTTVTYIATGTELQTNTANFVTWSSYGGNGATHQWDPYNQFNIVSADHGMYTITASNCFNGNGSDGFIYSSSVEVAMQNVTGCMDSTDPNYSFSANTSGTGLLGCTCIYATIYEWFSATDCSNSNTNDGTVTAYLSGGQYTQGMGGTGNATFVLQRKYNTGGWINTQTLTVPHGDQNDVAGHTFTGLGAGGPQSWRVIVSDANGCPANPNAAPGFYDSNSPFSANGC